MELNVDLANNTPLARTIIDIIRIIVDIENSTPEGEKPALNQLKQQLIEVYGTISMSQYALDRT